MVYFGYAVGTFPGNSLPVARNTVSIHFVEVFVNDVKLSVIGDLR